MNSRVARGARRTGGAGYVHGTAARKLERDGQRARRVARRQQTVFRTIPGNPPGKKISRWETLVHLGFMTLALLITAAVLFKYVNVQSNLESSNTTIASLEKELTSLRRENDEAYSRANATVDLEEIKRVAIQELGMKYAEDGQIVSYSDEGAADYVRQIASIPDIKKKNKNK